MRLALLADLHFGRENPDVLDDLLRAIDLAQPDRVLIAGDFVQRARSAHYAPARAFLDRLGAPWDAVPGNHDLPLYNLPARLFRPRAAYRRWIAAETEPLIETDAARIIGLDTTDRFAHQRGRIRDQQIRRVCGLIGSAGGRMPIILAHHPFHQRPETAKKLMHGGPAALAAWADCGPHMILSGHLHSFLVEPFVARKGREGMTLQVHCGSSTSTRQRGNDNDLALLEIAGDSVVIRRQIFVPGKGFPESACYEYRASSDGWSKA